MSKFNEKSEGSSVKNYMGAKGFKEASPKIELTHLILTSFIEDSYYEKQKDTIDRISNLVAQVAIKDPVFVGKLAVFARTVFNMRSSFHVLSGELSRVHRGDNLVSRVIATGAIRVDDLTEIVSYLKKPLPNQVKKGISKALNKFSEYQLAKYSSIKKKVSLVDLFNLVHPKAENGNAEVFKKVIEGKLTQTGQTWEARLSAGDSHNVVWKDMLKKKELGYMACLRNLRNIFNTKDSETIQLAVEFITNKEAVLKSKQLPFRFLSAYKALKENDAGTTISFESDEDSKILTDAVEKALLYSIENIPVLDGDTMILTDNSGSMRGDAGGHSLLSAYSKRTTSDIANLFAVLYWTRAESTYIGLFGDKLLKPDMDRRKSIMDNFNIINNKAKYCGVSTETGIFHAFESLIKENRTPKRIVIFSDCEVGTDMCQWYDTKGNRGDDFNKLFQKFMNQSPSTMVYCVNLRGYGHMLVKDRMCNIAGWSDRIFDIMQNSERDPHALITMIEETQI